MTKLLLNPVVHQFFDFLRLVGLRDRLRCPHCAAIGTWKPHGGWLDQSDERKVRRWLCKWCGWYVGPEGQGFGGYSQSESRWETPWDKGLEKLTPELAVRKSRISKAWPWRG